MNPRGKLEFILGAATVSAGRIGSAGYTPVEQCRSMEEFLEEGKKLVREHPYLEPVYQSGRESALLSGMIAIGGMFDRGQNEEAKEPYRLMIEEIVQWSEDISRELIDRDSG